TGAQEVQCRRVGGGTAHDHRDVEFVDELLEVEGLGVLRDVLGRDRGAADDEQVDAGIDDGLIRLSVGIEDVADLVRDLSR
ncbi:PLP-dependent transferase, partial [Bacillus sp. S34]|nr:PLP-dependent transferase [Bacillus sp. S34]